LGERADRIWSFQAENLAKVLMAFPPCAAEFPKGASASRIQPKVILASSGDKLKN